MARHLGAELLGRVVTVTLAFGKQRQTQRKPCVEVIHVRRPFQMRPAQVTAAGQRRPREWPATPAWA